MSEYLLKRKLQQITHHFELEELSLLWTKYPATYYLTTIELRVLWQAFSETACASWLVVTKDTVRQFADWIKEATDRG